MVLHENWYSNSQIVELLKVANMAKQLNGIFIEIGCWEGKSTVALANEIYPLILNAVDTWKGNINEDPNHITIKTLEERDVYSVFMENMRTDTKGNVNVYIMDCFEYLENKTSPIAFCHIDASHNYEDVKKTIELTLPYIVNGGILCGDDFESANINRADLNGGVERAVTELLPGYVNIGNFWYWKKEE